MKRRLLLLFFSVFAKFISAQILIPSCGSDEILSNLLGTNPAALQQHLQIEQSIYNHNLSGSRGGGGTYVLPVVVHIIHNGGAENISDAQVANAISYLNQAYANIGYYDSTTGVNTDIRFCLAKQNPQGQATTGINRVQSPLTNVDMNTQDLALKNLSRWNPNCYVNIWIVNDICSSSSGTCSVAGYAYFPSAHGSNIDGIVVEATYFGSSPANTSVTAHELGHYLGLYHTFQGGCTNNNCLTDGDKVCDTPPDQSTAAVACLGSVNTCSTDALSGFTTDQPDLHRDYMDYGNPACMNIFTAGQRDRMYWHIDNVRHSLLNCPSCNNPCTSNITAQFASSSSNTTVGSSVSFTNQSTGANSYTWFINNVQFSTSASPNYFFNTEGTFIIRLKAVGADTSCVSFFSDTITVTCGTVAGFTQSTTQVNVGQSVTFTNTSIGAVSYQWFVDGALQSSATNFTYTFNQGGTFSVYLIAVGSSCSDTTSFTNFVHVGPPCNISFTHSPDTANTCQPVFFVPDTTCQYSNYYWTFCEPEFLSSISVTLHSNGSNGTNPCGPSLLKDHLGNYYTFYTNYNASASPYAYRVDFGASITNPSPTYHAINTPGITSASMAHAIDIFYDGGNYYGFILFNNKIYRLEFGSSITNTNPTVAQITGINTNILQWGHKIQVVRETNNYWLICASRNTGTITLLYLGNSITNNAVQQQFDNTCTGASGFSYHKIDGMHYIYATGIFDGIKKMSFGNSLANTPVIGTFQSFGTGTYSDVALYQNCDGSLDGFLIKENNSDHKIIHLDSANANFRLVGNLDSLVRAANISRLVRTDEGMTALVANGVANGLGHISLGDCGVPYSTLQFPSPVHYNSAGTYYVRLAVDEGLPTQQVYCQSIMVADLTSNPVCLGNDTTICANQAFTLHAGSGYSSYLWQDGSVDSTLTVYSGGTYWVEVHDNCNQIHRDTIEVSVDSNTVINLTDTTFFCQAGIVSLVAPLGFQHYSWSPSQAVACDTCRVTTAAPITTTTYTVTCRRDGGCINAGSMTAYVSGTTVSISSTNTVCGASNGSARVINSGVGTTYLWSNGQTTDSISDLAAGTYVVTVTHTSGCSATASVVIGASNIIPPIVGSDKSIICAGDSAHICVTSTYATYQWNTGETGQCIYAKQAGNYYATVTDASGCSATSTNRESLNVYPQSAISISINGDTLRVYNATQCQWLLNGSPIPNATNPIYVAQQSGIYSVLVTDSNGCWGTSTNISIITNGIDELAGAEDIILHPNPLNKESLQLAVGRSFIGSKVEIFDSNGRLIHNSEVRSEKSEIYLEIQSGVYLVKIISDKKNVTKKLIKL